ncbi:MAG: helix-turn-helix transcriptional regulator [Phycisphaeraceae bacterium]
MMPASRKPVTDQLRDAIARAEKRGITRYQLSKRSGVSQQVLSNIVRGTTPRLDNAERIAAALGLRLIIKKS